MLTNISKIISWKSKGLSEEGIQPSARSDNSLSPGQNYVNNGSKMKVKDESEIWWR